MEGVLQACCCVYYLDGFSNLFDLEILSAAVCPVADDFGADLPGGEQQDFRQVLVADDRKARSALHGHACPVYERHVHVGV